MIKFFTRYLRRSRFNAEVMRFIVAGITAVGTDFLSYYLLSQFINFSLAKGFSFVLGSIVAYIINKFWTFNVAKNHWHDVLKFTALYTFTLGANVLSNKLVLYGYPKFWVFAFLIATGVSTILNYLGMKYWVFRHK